MVEIHHKVEEIEPTTIPATLDVFRREPVVFRENGGQHVLSERVGRIAGQHHRFDGDLLKARVGQGEHVVREIQIARRERAAHVIALIAALFRKGERVFQERKASSTLIVVSHSVSTIRKNCDNAAVLFGGKLMCFANLEDALTRYQEICDAQKR